MLNPLSQVQLETLTLWYLVQHSLSSFYKIHSHYPQLSEALRSNQFPTWQALGIHKNHLQRFQEFHTAEGQKKFQQCLHAVEYSCDFLITHTETDYPQAQPAWPAGGL